MKNVNMTRTGNKLVIEVDLSQDFGKSKSGKSTIVASTDGNIDVPGFEGGKIGFNIYKVEPKA